MTEEQEGVEEDSLQGLPPQNQPIPKPPKRADEPHGATHPPALSSENDSESLEDPKEAADKALTPTDTKVESETVQQEDGQTLMAAVDGGNTSITSPDSSVTREKEEDKGEEGKEETQGKAIETQEEKEEISGEEAKEVGADEGKEEEEDEGETEEKGEVGGKAESEGKSEGGNADNPEEKKEEGHNGGVELAQSNHAESDSDQRPSDSISKADDSSTTSEPVSESKVDPAVNSSSDASGTADKDVASPQQELQQIETGIAEESESSQVEEEKGSTTLEEKPVPEDPVKEETEQKSSDNDAGPPDANGVVMDAKEEITKSEEAVEQRVRDSKLETGISQGAEEECSTPSQTEVTIGNVSTSHNPTTMTKFPSSSIDPQHLTPEVSATTLTQEEGEDSAKSSQEAALDADKSKGAASADQMLSSPHPEITQASERQAKVELSAEKSTSIVEKSSPAQPTPEESRAQEDKEEDSLELERAALQPSAFDDSLQTITPDEAGSSSKADDALQKETMGDPTEEMSRASENKPKDLPKELSVSTDPDESRRDSIVSSTEVVTSPGGTKTINVALSQIPSPQKLAEPPMKNNADVAVSQTPERALSKAAKVVQPPKQYGSAPTEKENLSKLIREDAAFDWGQDMKLLESEQDEMVSKFARKLELEREAEEAADAQDGESVDSMEDLMEAVKQHQQKASSNGRNPPLDATPSSMPALDVTANINAVDLQAATASSGPLEEKDRQIATLQDQLMRALRGDCAVIDELDASMAVDQRDAKIVDLAKKNRSLHLTLERDRKRATQLQAKLLQGEDQLRSAQRELQLEQQKAKQALSIEESRMEAERRREDKALLRQLQQQLDSARLKADQAALESKRLKRLLIREVGEGPSLDKVLESLHLHNGSRAAEDLSQELVGWRGRAQQILKLKSKVKSLAKELEAARKAQPKVGSTQEIVGSSQRRGVDVDGRAIEEVKFIERGRRHSMEKLAHEIEEVEEKYQEAKQKADASRARIRVLENENKKMREQMKVLLSKTTNDDALVEALRREIKRLRADYSNVKGKVQLLESGTVSQLAYEELRQHSQSQAVQIERQDELLVKMRRQVERAQSDAGRKLLVK